MEFYNMNVCLGCVNTILTSFGPKVDEEIMSKLVIIVVILLLTMSGVFSACGRAEYLIGQECCPMCGPGYFVKRHCTEYTSTTCVPCFPSTFTDAPNGLISCRSCTVCDSGEGLKVKRACTFISDALCEPSEGHYCIDPIKDGCRGAEKHTECKPGQYIKQPGTPTSDTVCADCVGDTYSNGSFSFCRPHTQCELVGRVVITKGTASSDTECAEIDNSAAIIGGVVGSIVVFCGALIVFLILWRREKVVSYCETCFIRNTLRSDSTRQTSGPVETEVCGRQTESDSSAK